LRPFDEKLLEPTTFGHTAEKKERAKFSAFFTRQQVFCYPGNNMKTETTEYSFFLLVLFFGFFSFFFGFLLLLLSVETKTSNPTHKKERIGHFHIFQGRLSQPRERSIFHQSRLSRERTEKIIESTAGQERQSQFSFFDFVPLGVRCKSSNQHSLK